MCGLHDNLNLSLSVSRTNYQYFKSKLKFESAKICLQFKISDSLILYSIPKDVKNINKINKLVIRLLLIWL